MEKHGVHWIVGVQAQGCNDRKMGVFIQKLNFILLHTISDSTNRQLGGCLRDNRNLNEFIQVDQVLGSDLEFKLKENSNIITALPL